jgi:hypothetical protein
MNISRIFQIIAHFYLPLQFNSFLFYLQESFWQMISINACYKNLFEDDMVS